MTGLAAILRPLGIALIVAGVAFGQGAPAVPAAYQDLYSQLKTRLDAFDAQITRAWDGATFPTDFSAELITANGHRGQQLLSPNARVGTVLEIQNLRSLGARAVIVALPYPLLNRSYMQSIGRGPDYDGYLSYYTYVAGQIRDRGMRIVIENGPMFPGVFSSGSGIDAAQHYASLSDQQYVQARAEMAGVIAREIQPDYLQIGAEPDTEAQLTRKPSLASPTGYSGLISAALVQVRAAGAQQVEVGAGVGTWLGNGRDFIEAFVRAGVSFIDLHVYPINRGYLDNLIVYTDLANSLGKKVTIAEAWLLKIRDSELATSSPAADPTIFSRDTFSFWMPLDQQFLSVLVKFSHWKQIALTSAYWSKYLYAYLDYNAVSSQSAAQIIESASVAAANAIVAGRFSDTGRHYQSLIGAGTFALSNASYRADQLAPESILSVFGTGLATSLEAASVLPLPSTLRGTTATVVDSAGRQAAASVYLVSPSQLNLVLPPGLASGRAVMRITSGDGRQSSASMKIAPVGPGLSSANANGRGVAAAIVGRLAGDGTATFDLVFTCGQNGCVSKPIDLSGNDQFYLALFGTGIRNRSTLSRVVVTIGGIDLQPTFAGAQSEYPGLDQINVLAPKPLAGRGEVAVAVTVDGIRSNTLTVNFR